MAAPRGRSEQSFDIRHLPRYQFENLVCGLSANDLRDSFLSAGANAFVLKPIPCKPDDVKSMLKKILKPDFQIGSVEDV